MCLGYQKKFAILGEILSQRRCLGKAEKHPEKTTGKLEERKRERENCVEFSSRKIPVLIRIRFTVLSPKIACVDVPERQYQMKGMQREKRGT